MLHSQGSPKEPHSTDFSSASMEPVRSGLNVDGVAEVVADRVEGCCLLATDDKVGFN